MEDICPENYNSKVLVAMWADFINWNKRRLGENGFLLNTLKKFHCQSFAYKLTLNSFKIR